MRLGAAQRIVWPRMLRGHPQQPTRRPCVRRGFIASREVERRHGILCRRELFRDRSVKSVRDRRGIGPGDDYLTHQTRVLAIDEEVVSENAGLRLLLEQRYRVDQRHLILAGEPADEVVLATSRPSPVLARIQ